MSFFRNISKEMDFGETKISIKMCNLSKMISRSKMLLQQTLSKLIKRFE
jgi:hypothetical protein